MFAWQADADTLARLAERYLGKSAGSASENSDELRRASADAREMLADEAMPKFIGSKARDAPLSPPPPCHCASATCRAPGPTVHSAARSRAFR